MIDTSKLKKIEECKGRIKEIIGDAAILDLAKNGICPHYIVINPITQEESIFFISSELNEWLSENFVRYNQGCITPSFRFIHFNKEEFKAPGNVPVELSYISNLYYLPIENINTPPGIYFLCKGQKVQYIGQAKNVAARIITHISEGIKDFDSVYFIPYAVDRLFELETALIRHLQPPLNKTCQRVPTEEDLKIIKKVLTKEES